LTLHDSPPEIPENGNREVGICREAVAPIPVAGAAALASATGPTPPIAPVMAAMAVKRFSETNM
jgi:hypothetical protein